MRSSLWISRVYSTVNLNKNGLQVSLASLIAFTKANPLVLASRQVHRQENSAAPEVLGVWTAPWPWPSPEWAGKDFKACLVLESVLYCQWNGRSSSLANSLWWHCFQRYMDNLFQKKDLWWQNCCHPDGDLRLILRVSWMFCWPAERLWPHHYYKLVLRLRLGDHLPCVCFVIFWRELLCVCKVLIGSRARSFETFNHIWCFSCSYQRQNRFWLQSAPQSLRNSRPAMSPGNRPRGRGEWKGEGGTPYNLSLAP